MARITYFVVQTFVEAEGSLIAEEAVAFNSPRLAKTHASAISSQKAGVIAFAKSGDPDTGEWDESPEILFQAGRLSPMIYGDR